MKPMNQKKNRQTPPREDGADDKPRPIARNARWHESFQTGLHARLVIGDDAKEAVEHASEIADTASRHLASLAATERDEEPRTPADVERPAPSTIGNVKAHTTR